MLNEEDATRLSTIRATTAATVRQAIGDVSEVALLDAPNQRNVGDSLIWAGELAYLKRLGVRIAYASDTRSFDEKRFRRAHPSGVVLLHGGGNFGDLWPSHQEHRESLTRALPDYRFVQLSQSIFFGSEERAAKADRIIGAHPDFQLLTRDRLSLARAERQLPSIRSAYCPDMALGWDSDLAGEEAVPREEILVIAREDKEQASGLHRVGENWIAGLKTRVTDWTSYREDPLDWRVARSLATLNHKAIAARRKLGLPLPTLSSKRMLQTLSSINAINVWGATKLYSSARVVVVDRLHAHILALLLGIDHVVLDNNYRKLGSVFDEYTGAFTTANYATSVPEARQLVLRAVEE